jgi:hypothetical protein
MPPLRTATLLYDGRGEDQALFYDEDIQLRGSDNPLWHDDWGLYDKDPLFQNERKFNLQDYTYEPIINQQQQQQQQHEKQFPIKEKVPEPCSGFMCANIFLATCVIAGWLISHPNVAAAASSPVNSMCQSSYNQTFPELLETVSTKLSFCDEEVGDDR